MGNQEGFICLATRRRLRLLLVWCVLPATDYRALTTTLQNASATTTTQGLGHLCHLTPTVAEIGPRHQKGGEADHWGEVKGVPRGGMRA